MRHERTEDSPGGDDMSIWSRAPSRIDLAGGTLDIWPLYLLMDQGLTVNVAISVYSQAWLRPEGNDHYHLISEDSNLDATAHTCEELDVAGPLGLVARAVRHFAPAPGLTVVTRNEAPRGSGLGASSSLLVAVLAALQNLGGQAPDSTELVNLAADLEVQTIRVPTGKQDHYAAVCGGANAIWFGPGRTRVESLPFSDEFARRLREAMILSFTGESRSSGPTNWDAVKGYVDGREETRQGLDRIRETSLAVREAWLAQDIEALGRLLGEEWENRCRLAQGVSTPRIEKIVAAASRAGALASKICGAGGGGCLVTIAREGRRDDVRQALERSGAEVLDFDFDLEGLVVRRLP
jgi:D-glycero-alpha-D-manno-heptose-7-phosphate kinase